VLLPALVLAACSLAGAPGSCPRTPAPPVQDVPAAQVAEDAEAAAAPTRVLAESGPPVTSIAFTPDGRRLIGGASGAARIWDAESGELVAQHELGSRELRALRVSADGERILCLFEPFELRVLDLATGSVLDRARLTLETPVRHLAWHPDGDRAFVDGAPDGVVLYDFAAASARSIHVDAPAVTALALDARGRWIAVGGADASLTLASTQPFEAKRHFAELDATPTALAFDPLAKVVAIGGADGGVRVLRAFDGRPSLALDAHEAAVVGIAFDGRGRRFASVDEACRVGVWAAKDGRALASLDPGREARALELAFNPTRDQVAVCAEGLERGVLLWDLEAAARQ